MRTLNQGIDLRKKQRMSDEGRSGNREKKGKRRSKGGCASCPLGIYGALADAGEPQHMEPICLCRVSGSFNNGAGGLWRESLRAKHVPGIRMQKNVCFFFPNSSTRFYKDCKHIC